MKDKIVRIKEIIITAGGENVAPTNIEEEIKTELPEVWNNVAKNEEEKNQIMNLNLTWEVWPSREREH